MKKKDYKFGDSFKKSKTAEKKLSKVDIFKKKRKNSNSLFEILLPIIPTNSGQKVFEGGYFQKKN